jgi:hypothetical protein
MAGAFHRRVNSSPQVLFRTAQTTAAEPPFTPDQIHYLQDLDPLSPALRKCDVGVDQKGGEPERYAARKSKMVSTGEGTTMNSIESLTARIS